jgi:hypothetical protein
VRITLALTGNDLSKLLPLTEQVLAIHMVCQDAKSPMRPLERLDGQGQALLLGGLSQGPGGLLEVACPISHQDQGRGGMGFPPVTIDRGEACPTGAGGELGWPCTASQAQEKNPDRSPQPHLRFLRG